MNEWEEEDYKYLKNLFLAFTSKSEMIKEFIHQTGKEMLRTHLDGNKYIRWRPVSFPGHDQPCIGQTQG